MTRRGLFGLLAAVPFALVDTKRTERHRFITIRDERPLRQQLPNNCFSVLTVEVPEDMTMTEAARMLIPEGVPVTGCQIRSL